MLRRFSFALYLAAAFLILSGIAYFVHYLIFRDIRHIFIYMIGDLAFLPVEVLLVVIILERVLAHREKQAKLKKLNMVVGTFFIEVGNYLFADLLKHFDNQLDISRHLNINENWTKKEFRKAVKFARHLEIDLDCRKMDLGQIKSFLAQKREFILALLGNPNLLEHDRFTDLLWAVTRLDKEFEARPSGSDLPDRDLEHIASDIQRLYDHLASEWLDYIEHLRDNYPFLFSLVLRTHPFQEHPSPVFT